MARTYRIDNTRDGRAYEGSNRRRWFATESKGARKDCTRKLRRAEDRFLRHDDPDATLDPRPVGTQGYLTH